MSIQCVRCEQGSVNVLTDTMEVEYKGKPLSYSMVYSLCDSCGDEFISTEQIKQNDEAFRVAKRKSDGLLSPLEIRTARELLSINQEMAALIFGGGKNAFSKYERGEVTQSQSMDSLLRICLNHRNLMAEIAEMRGIDFFENACDDDTVIIRDVHRMATVKVNGSHKINDGLYNKPKETQVISKTEYQRAS